MNNQTDAQLLIAYVEHRSDPAFAELLRRHVDLVHSAALRMVCDSHLAQDVTQAVFAALAKSAAQLTNCLVLSSWLHRTAQNIAAQTVRTNVRRRDREQEAATMNKLLAAETDAGWEDIAPHLDAAIGELGEADRDALLLRYFERKSASEMAQTLGISDEAAQKRVNRAVERLREFFAKRGIAIGASGLVVIIFANAVQAAPVGLAVAISTAVALTGTTATLATHATMNWLNLKSIVAILAAALAAGTSTHLIQKRESNRLRAEQQNLLAQQETLASDRDAALTAAAAKAAELEQLQKDKNELLRLRGEVGLLRGQAKELESLKQANQQLAKALAAQNAPLAQMAPTITFADATQFPISSKDISGTVMRAALELDSTDPSQKAEKHWAIVLFLTSAKAKEFLEFKQTHLNQPIQMMVGTNIAKEPAILSGDKVSSIQVYFNSSKEAVEFADAAANGGL